MTLTVLDTSKIYHKIMINYFIKPPSVCEYERLQYTLEFTTKQSILLLSEVYNESNITIDLNGFACFEQVEVTIINEANQVKDWIILNQSGRLNSMSNLYYSNNVINMFYNYNITRTLQNNMSVSHSTQHVNNNDTDNETQEIILNVLTKESY